MSCSHGRNYLVRHLIGFPQIDYDEHADLLMKPCGQMLRHLRNYLPDERAVVLNNSASSMRAGKTVSPILLSRPMLRRSSPRSSGETKFTTTRCRPFLCKPTIGKNAGVRRVADHVRRDLFFSNPKKADVIPLAAMHGALDCRDDRRWHEALSRAENDDDLAANGLRPANVYSISVVVLRAVG